MSDVTKTSVTSFGMKNNDRGDGGGGVICFISEFLNFPLRIDHYLYSYALELLCWGYDFSFDFPCTQTL